MFEPSTLLQVATNSTSTSTTQTATDTLTQLWNLVVVIFVSTMTIGDAISRLLQIIFSAVGIKVDLWVFRIITIVATTGMLWRVFSSAGFLLKWGLVFVLFSLIFGLLGFSWFGGGLIHLPPILGGAG